MIDWSLEDKIPSPYERQQADGTAIPARAALVEVFDEIFGGISAAIQSIETAKSAEEVPVQFIDLLGDLLAAGVRITDTETMARRRVQFAVQTHRNRGLFVEDIKPRLDLITGLSASLFKYAPGTFPNLWNRVSAATPAQQAVRGQGTTQIGILRDSGASSIASPYTVLIDLGGGAGLSLSVVQACINELRADFLPAYLAVFLGYTGGIAGFTPYSNGEL